MASVLPSQEQSGGWTRWQGQGDKGHQYPGWEPVLCSPVRFTLTQSRALGETQDKHLYNVTCDDMAG